MPTPSRTAPARCGSIYRAGATTCRASRPATRSRSWRTGTPRSSSTATCRPRPRSRSSSTPRRRSISSWRVRSTRPRRSRSDRRTTRRAMPHVHRRHRGAPPLGRRRHRLQLVRGELHARRLVVGQCHLRLGKFAGDFKASAPTTIHYDRAVETTSQECPLPPRRRPPRMHVVPRLQQPGVQRGHVRRVHEQQRLLRTSCAWEGSAPPCSELYAVCTGGSSIVILPSAPVRNSCTKISPALW